VVGYQRTPLFIGGHKTIACQKAPREKRGRGGIGQAYSFLSFGGVSFAEMGKKGKKEGPSS